MAGVKIRKTYVSSTHRILDLILIFLGLLTLMILAFNRPFKFNVMEGLYGPLAPLFIVAFVIILIIIYLKINEN